MLRRGLRVSVGVACALLVSASLSHAETPRPHTAPAREASFGLEDRAVHRLITFHDSGVSSSQILSAALLGVDQLVIKTGNRAQSPRRQAGRRPPWKKKLMWAGAAVAVGGVVMMVSSPGEALSLGGPTVRSRTYNVGRGIAAVGVTMFMIGISE